MQFGWGLNSDSINVYWTACVPGAMLDASTCILSCNQSKNLKTQIVLLYPSFRLRKRPKEEKDLFEVSPYVMGRAESWTKVYFFPYKFLSLLLMTIMIAAILRVKWETVYQVLYMWYLKLLIIIPWIRYWYVCFTIKKPKLWEISWLAQYEAKFNLLDPKAFALFSTHTLLHFTCKTAMDSQRNYCY